jgi:hypothetical protein
MSLRLLFVFVHVLSAMSVSGSLAIEGVMLLRLRRAATALEMRDALHSLRALRLIGPVTLAPTMMSGMYLARTVWGWHTAWIDVALASLVAGLGGGAVATALRVRHLKEPDRRNDDYRRDPVLRVSFLMKAATFTGIVFLMTVKPGLELSLAGMIAAAVAGILASIATVWSGAAGEQRGSRAGIGKPAAG